MKLFALALILNGAGLHAAQAPVSAPAGEELAGEREALPQGPVAKPTAAEPEQGGPVSLTRTTKPGQAPSFELPELVVTGSGERKALGTRPDLNVWMDTSGGIKASPGEENASKNQLGAQGSREVLESLTEAARPSYGQMRAVYGLANTFEGRAFFGQELGQFFYMLNADLGFSDGGPHDAALPAINQSGHAGALARGGWRQNRGGQLSGEAFARRRSRLWTKLALPAPRIEREWQGGRLSWDGAPSDKIRHSVQASVDRALILLPGLGTSYVESQNSLKASFDTALETRHSRTRVTGEAYFGDLCQDNGARAPLLAGGWILFGFEPWRGGHFGLGMSLDSISGGGLSSLLLAPRAEFEQYLGGGLSAWGRFAPRLELPTLTGQGGFFDKDPVVPSRLTLPSPDQVNAEAGISASLARNIGLEIKATARQNDDAFLLDDPAASGLWTTANVRRLRRLGLEFTESSPLGAGFSQKAGVALQGAELLDLGAPDKATFAPMLRFQAALEWGRESLRAGLRLAYVGEREGRLAGGMSLPAYADLGASAEYEINESFSLLAEGGNLLSQKVAEFPGYPEAAPFAGLGLKYQF